MIAFLCGTILSKTDDSLILDVHDIGYRLMITKTCSSETKTGQSLELFVHHYIREDVNDLYGFKEQAELLLFEKLISVSGVGPKSALAILSLAPAASLHQAIVQGDDSLLTKVSGIGGKTAQRIVLELRGKLDQLMTTSGSAHSEELEALVSLGYSVTQAREALQKVDSHITDSGERIRQALQYM